MKKYIVKNTRIGQESKQMQGGIVRAFGCLMEDLDFEVGESITFGHHVITRVA